MAGRKDFERKAFSDEGMPSVEYAQSLLDMNNNQRRELARLNAKCDALQARLAEAEAKIETYENVVIPSWKREEATWDRTGVTQEMVDRFLTWVLPPTVRVDPCAMNPDFLHRSGTNLLTAVEARAMLEHVLGASDSAPAVNTEAEEWRQELVNATRPIVCGEGHGEGTGGCGRPVAYNDYYRCTDCGIRMHQQCLQKHFRQHTASASVQEFVDTPQGLAINVCKPPPSLVCPHCGTDRWRDGCPSIEKGGMCQWNAADFKRATETVSDTANRTTKGESA